MIWKATKITPPTTARKATINVAARAGRDTGNHLIPAQLALRLRPADLACGHPEVIRQAVTVVAAFQCVIAVASDHFLNRFLASFQGMQAGCPLMPLIVTVVVAHKQQPST